ncbi:hypothetical protein GCM10022402_16410 [Salinactinospora qingdaonensis]|uniref:Uncharacterized protein n=1 Tax=Salinactinospora qingdaonensis TaxID=702744 RepID=A0ABP7FE04_9ACTN
MTILAVLRITDEGTPRSLRDLDAVARTTPARRASVTAATSHVAE